MPAQNRQRRTRRQLILEEGQPYEVRECRRSERKARESKIVKAAIRGKSVRRVILKKYCPNRDQIKEELAYQRRVWRTLKSAGLPIVDTFRPIIRRRSKLFGTIIMNDLKRKYGKIYPINNEFGEPVFLRQIKDNNHIVRELASDLAIMHMNGLRLRHLDCWHFYKKQDGSWGRVLLDFEMVGQVCSKRPFEETLDVGIMENIDCFRKYFSGKNFLDFEKAYKQTVYNSTHGYYPDARAHEEKMRKIRAKLNKLFLPKIDNKRVLDWLNHLIKKLRKLKQ